MKEPVVHAMGVMRDVESWLRRHGAQPGTPAEVAFTCGLHVGRLETAEAILRVHEERAERSRAAAAKARKASRA